MVLAVAYIALCKYCMMIQAGHLACASASVRRATGLPPARWHSSTELAALTVPSCLQGIKPLSMGLPEQPDMQAPQDSQQTTGEQQTQPPSQPYGEHSTSPSPHDMPPSTGAADGNEMMTFRQELVGGA